MYLTHAIDRNFLEHGEHVIAIDFPDFPDFQNPTSLETYSTSSALSEPFARNMQHEISSARSE